MAVFTSSYFDPSGTSSNSDVYYRFNAANTGFYVQSGATGTIWAAAGGNRMLTISSTSFGVGDFSAEGSVPQKGGAGLEVERGSAITKYVSGANQSGHGRIQFTSRPDLVNYNIAGMRTSSDVNAKLTQLFWTLPATNTSGNTTDTKLTLTQDYLLHKTTSANGSSTSQGGMASPGFYTARTALSGVASGVYVDAFDFKASASNVSQGPMGNNAIGVWIVTAGIAGTSSTGNYVEVALVSMAPGSTPFAGGTVTVLKGGSLMDIRLDPTDNGVVQVNQTSGSPQIINATAIRLM